MEIESEGHAKIQVAHSIDGKVLYFPCKEVVRGKLCVLTAELDKFLTNLVKIEKPLPEPIVSNDKPLTETERNTMLTLILGMAVDAYGYDPTQVRSSLTGTGKDSLTVMLQTRGYDVSDDTIRKYLKEAAEKIKPCPP